MADGRLKCCGSSFFLKKRFGAGYHLICVKEPGCNSHDVTKLLKKYLPNIHIATDIGAELGYQLPDDDTTFFQQMFNDLENNMQSLQLSSFGVSLTTLEDVFHKVGSDSLHQLPPIDNGEEYNIRNRSDAFSESWNESTVLLRGLALIYNQWCAMFKKKFYYWKRNWIIYAVINILAIALVVHSGLDDPDSSTEPTSLPISLATYRKSVIILDAQNVKTPGGLTSKLVTLLKRRSTVRHFRTFFFRPQNNDGVRKCG